MHPLHPHHARELEASGIAPETVAQRGSRSVTAAECAALGFAPYQCGDGLLLPQHTLAGVQRGHKLKRDVPRIDKDGKPVKYEVPEGAIPAFDVHPAVRHLLRATDTTVYFTEGLKKEDALVSRGVLCVDIGSVWMFLHRKLVVPDLDDIPLDGRLARIVFDSDLASKPSVAEALLRFAAALYRRGARVEVVHLPPGPDGAKTGVDDFLAGGGTVADLDALARPWTGEGSGVWLRGTDDADDDALHRELAEARRLNRAFVSVVNTPHLTAGEKIAACRAVLEMKREVAQGRADGGRVRVSPSRVALDFRKEPGATTNPGTGSLPIMSRSSASATLQRFESRGLLAVQTRPVRTLVADPGQTQPREVTVAEKWVNFTDPAATLDVFARWRPDAPKARKPYTRKPICPDCGSTHLATVCRDCGSIVAERGRSPSPGAEESPMEKISPSENGVRGATRLGSPLTVKKFSPSENGTDDPPLAAAQAAITAADSARDPAAQRRAREDLGARLEASARAQGRTPVPKPTPTPTPLADFRPGPGAFPDDNEDRWRHL